MNSNNSSIPNSSATSFISHESSISQLSGDIFHILLWLADNIGGQDDYNSAATASRCIAGMTSQIRPLSLSVGGVDCTGNSLSKGVRTK